MKEIKLTQNQIAIVDDEDHDWLSQWKWCVGKLGKNGTPYAVRNKEQGNVLSMARAIMQLNKGDGKTVDHINKDTLDNRKANLRICTHQQNNFNRGPMKNTSSQYKGVHWFKRNKIWFAQIKINYKQIHIGSFKSEIEAAKAYDKKAKELHGEFARLNFP